MAFKSLLCKHLKTARFWTTFSASVSHSCSTSATDSSVIVSTENAPLVQFPEFLTRSVVDPREALVESLQHSSPVGLISLHPDVFGTLPVLAHIHSNLKWQAEYKRVELRHALNRAEIPGTLKRPWPQKGMGKARHGTVKSPIWYRGGCASGPRKYQTSFYMPSLRIRVLGLTSTLSAKFAQDDLKVVDNLSLPTSDPEYLKQLIEQRSWGPSVLFADVADIMPENITIALDTVAHYNLMPVYSLNVHGMLKHDTLVLTVAAVREIERRIEEAVYSPISHTRDDEYKTKYFDDENLQLGTV